MPSRKDLMASILKKNKDDAWERIAESRETVGTKSKIQEEGI